jgi:hypothetical protein
VGTGRRDLEIGEVLKNDDLVDSVPFKWRESVY